MHIDDLKAPGLALKVPAGHSIPVELGPATPVPSGQYLPAAHFRAAKLRDAAAASGHAYPIGQGKQVPWIGLGWYVPATQAVSATLPAMHFLPTAQPLVLSVGHLAPASQ